MISLLRNYVWSNGVWCYHRSALNTRLSHAEITDMLNVAGAEDLFIHKEFLTGRTRGIENSNIHSYEHLLKTQPDNDLSTVDLHEEDAL
ncbi:hypothetical protein ACIFOT_15630 [Neobacillus sp. NRS-1170]|uniref:hypothetical protein n=1 Tax=Neobacillus sp. NRS-1170 TaxID=3233898 RepID=UPI003D2DEF14